MNGIARDSGRPSSLSLVQLSTVDGSSGLVTTPMVFSTLGLNCMVDGYTGLTPITGGTPFLCIQCCTVNYSMDTLNSIH